MRNPKSNYDLQVDTGKKLFLEYEQETLIRKFQLQADELWIYIRYLNTPYRINRKDGSVEELTQDAWKACRTYTTVMTIYDLLCFHQGKNLPALLGQWCAVGTFVVTGVQDAGAFTKKYAQLFSGHIARLKAACEAMGGILLPSMAGADVTCQFPATPFFPVLLQFWEGDEEFPAKLALMWDRNTDQFLHFETTFYLQGDLLERLKDHMQRMPSLPDST